MRPSRTTPPARVPAPRPAGPALAADKPDEQALYQDGPEGRYLLDGDWLFRLDNADQGITQHFDALARSTTGWTTVKVPNVWNVGDASNESMSGGIGWYRKDFELPESDVGARLGAALRVGQLPHAGVAQRRPRGREHRRLHPVRVRAQPPQAQRDEPARRPRRLPPPRPRLPAERPEHRRRPHRRLVELLRHPARGLPQEARHRRLPEGPGAPGDRLRDVRGERPDADQPAQRHRLAASGSRSPASSAAGA